MNPRSHRTRIRRIRAVAAAIVALCLSLATTGCASRTFVASTPAGFVDLGTKYPEGEYRATTADGVIIGVRAFDNDPRGPLSFWSRTIERRMREMGGYALISRKEVNGRGVLQKGVSFRFGHDEGKEPFIYDLTIFVTSERVYVIEDGGPKAEVLKQQSELDAFVARFAAK